LIGLAVLPVLAVSCEMFETYPEPKGWYEGPKAGESGMEQKERTSSEPTRKVLLVYSAGYNSLRVYLKEDLEDLTKGYVPRDGFMDDVLLVLSHLNAKGGDYKTPTEPVLFRLTTNRAGKVVADTLLCLTPGPVTTKESLQQVLTYIHDRFPAQSYGMVFSSHASGWLPPGYYANPEDKYFDSITWEAPRRRLSYSGPVPVHWPEPDEGPAVKSIGQEQIDVQSYEMTLREFAGAFPMHFDYILIDACLMGGVEVAWEFRNICDGIGFSQAEVLAEGFDYTKITRHLLENETPDPVSVCSDYFDYYNARSGSFRSATISFVRTDRMEALAEVCKTLFARYRPAMEVLNPKSVQNFGRKMSDGGDRGWYFDLKDVLEKAGASEEDLASLQEALDGCIVYKAATPVLLGSIPINAFSGLTVHLPAYGTDFLNNYYKENVSWNDATTLVE
jgi:hypothetical protein